MSTVKQFLFDLHSILQALEHQTYLNIVHCPSLNMMCCSEKWMREKLLQIFYEANISTNLWYFSGYWIVFIPLSISATLQNSNGKLCFPHSWSVYNDGGRFYCRIRLICSRFVLHRSLWVWNPKSRLGSKWIQISSNFMFTC